MWMKQGTKKDEETAAGMKDPLNGNREGDHGETRSITSATEVV